MKLSRRQTMVALGAAVPSTLLLRPALHLGLSFARDRAGSEPTLPGEAASDAGRLEHDDVERVRPRGTLEQASQQLREVLSLAQQRGRKVSIAGARHSMGGQTRLPAQVQLDMLEMNAMRLDAQTGLLWVQAGARWRDILSYLDGSGHSVRVMQSNADFTVGGSLSVNCHGWQPNSPPVASSVESLRLMLADGSVVTCSRNERPELFSLVLGGYGLFGVVLDVQLRITNNNLLRRRTSRLTPADYAAHFATHAGTAELAYGRLSVVPETRFEEALLTVYEAVPEPPALPKLTDARETPLARTLFRGQVGSNYGKALRWRLEQWFGGETGAEVTRNQALSEPVATFQNRRPELTDILQEYFIPKAQLGRFAKQAAEVLGRTSGVDLLNCTLRNVLPDPDAFLRYAREEVFGFVMLFCSERTQAAAERLDQLGRELTEAALALGGTYYLPYRLGANPAQLRRAYPMARDFFGLKHRYDPTTLFSNHFYERYRDV